MDDRFNTIAGWVLFAGIVASDRRSSRARCSIPSGPRRWAIRSPAWCRKASGAAAAEQPIEFYLAKADPAKGQQVFNKCAACHNADKGGANQLGPNLWDVIGEPIGQGKGFAFSDALSKKGGTWNWDNLSQWLTSPQGVRAGHQDDLRGPQQPAGPRQRHRFPQSAQRCAQADARRRRPKPSRAPTCPPNGNPPGNGPNNGPQKADNEPTLPATAAGKIAADAAAATLRHQPSK